MIIKQVEIFAIHLPLIDPFIISYATYDTMPSIILKVTTDTGVVGYGEAVPDEHVTGESWESTYAVLKHQLVPAIIGESPMAFEKLHDKMNKVVKDVQQQKQLLILLASILLGKR